MTYIKEYQEGNKFFGIYLCKSKQVLKTKAGKTYYSLLLQDKTGIIDGKVWELTNAINDFDSMDFIMVDGMVTTFQGSRQVNINRIRQAQEGEYDPKEYIPASKYDIPQMYEQLKQHIEGIKEPHLHRLAEMVFVDDTEIAKEFQQHSAAKSVHHCFIGGHPMAGSEQSGFEHSSDHLLENAYYILTPTAKVAKEKVSAYKEFVTSLKALPVILDYNEHDIITGTISHLPHIIASTLVNFVHDTDTADGLMKALAAGGFKDITRIASSSPVMWQQICLKNGENISHILGHYIEALTQAKEQIDAENETALYSMFEDSRDYRNSMPNSSAGPIKKQFALYCDIIDEAGGIATIATILASNHISIKNIGIIHNREFEEGVLRIEFYDEDSAANASKLLQKYRYVIYEV